MFKLLRKYDKWILAIGGSLLMVVFLLPQALQQFGANPQKAVAATYQGGKTITEKDRIDAQRELGMLDRISPLINSSILQLGTNPDGADSELDPALHWLLLTQDAKADGLIGGVQDGRDFLSVAARFFGRQYVLQNRFAIDINQFADTEAQVTRSFAAELENARIQLINDGGIPPVMVDRTLAKARGVLRMYEAYLAFDLPALQESLDLCHRYFDSADIVFYTAGSDAFIDPAYEPDDTEILVQYAAYKEDFPGESQFGFGYRAEDRVRLEWLRIVRQEISDAVIVDPVDANTRWRGNRTQYPGEFAAERANVENDIRNSSTESILKDAEQLVREELLKSRSGLSQNPDGTYDLPADWSDNRPSYLEIAQRIGTKLRERHGASMPNPSATNDSSRWRTRAEVRGIPIIGNTSKLIGPRNVPIVELAFSPPEIDPEAAYPVQAGITQGPMVAATTADVIFFRVTEAAASAPLPLVDVRSKVIEDVRRMLAYELLKAEAPKMISEMLTRGVDGAAESRGSSLYKGVNVTMDRITPIDPVNSPPTFEIQKINSEEFRTAVMDRVKTFPLNQPLDRLNERDLLLSVPLDSRREIAIAGINNVIPLTTEAFRMIETQALQYNRTQELNFNALDSWPFSSTQMQARHDVKIQRRTNPDDEVASDEAEESEPVAGAESTTD